MMRDVERVRGKVGREFPARRDSFSFGELSQLVTISVETAVSETVRIESTPVHHESFSEKI
jgi:hypothetical protein